MAKDKLFAGFVGAFGERVILKNMITLLLGTDVLVKKQHIAQAAKLRQAEVEVFSDAASLPANLAGLFGQQLFGPPKVVVLNGLWKKLDLAELLETVGNDKDAALFLVEDSVDKRVTANKDFLKHPRVKVVELNSPVGTRESSDWILKYANENKIKIQQAAAFALAQALLVDEDASLNVLQAQNELQKLKHFAGVDEKGENEITKEMVGEVVETVTGVDVFALLNAIATKNKKLALQMLETFFETETSDEKANAIKVAALLSDQFRSLLIAIDSDTRRIPDEAVIKMTGWKSGRLFIMKKLSRNFTAPKVQQALLKLENLDRELKTGSMPPHVVLDLIIAGI